MLRDLVVPTALAGGRNRGIGHPMASAAVDVAVTDLSLRRQGVPLATALGHGDAQAPGLAWTAVVGIGSTVDEVLAEVDDALRSGAASVKLKIRPGWDIGTGARGARRASGPAHLGRCQRLVRARRHRPPRRAGSHPGRARRLPRAAAGGGRPVRPDPCWRRARRRGSRSTRRWCRPPMPASSAPWAAAGSINVKPARLGGVSSTLALAELVASIKPKRRPETFLGGMFETGVGRSAALALGRALRHTGRDRPRPERVVLRRRHHRATGAGLRRAALGIVRTRARASRPGPIAWPTWWSTA